MLECGVGLMTALRPLLLQDPVEVVGYGDRPESVPRGIGAADRQLRVAALQPAELPFQEGDLAADLGVEGVRLALPGMWPGGPEVLALQRQHVPVRAVW